MPTFVAVNTHFCAKRGLLCSFVKICVCFGLSNLAHQKDILTNEKKDLFYVIELVFFVLCFSGD